MFTCYFNFFLLDDSVVLKVITIYNKDTDTMEEVLLEELQVFKVFISGTCLNKGGIVQHHRPSLHRYWFVYFNMKAET